MKCPICETYRWKDPQEIVWKSPQNGKGYCVFHAPREGKCKSLGSLECFSGEEFNELVFKRIDQTLCVAGQVCDLMLTIFPTGIWFTRYGSSNPLPPLKLSGAKFLENVNFDSAKFSRIAAFDGVTFSKEATFWNARFEDVTFNGAHFCGDVTFAETQIKGLAVFKNVVADRKVVFGTDFYGEVLFGNAEFNGAVVYKNTNFFDAAQFESTKFLQVVRFKQVSFHRESNFSKSVLKRGGDFSTIQFDGVANFLNIECTIGRAISFEGLARESMEYLLFTEKELRKFEFHDCQWPCRLCLDICSEYTEIKLSSCKDLYMALKQRAASELDQSYVSQWHFREKFMKLKQQFPSGVTRCLLEVIEAKDVAVADRFSAWCRLFWTRPHWPKISLTGLYWASSGFGERAERAGVFLMFLLLLPFLANSFIAEFFTVNLGMVPGARWLASLLGLIGDSVNATAAMQYIPFTKDIGDINTPGWRKVGQGLWQCLVILQFTLFALAVRNRFRR